MNAFEFNTVASMVIEWGGAARLGEILSESFEARKVLLVTDKGLVAAGLLDTPIASLNSAGFGVVVFDEIAPDPAEATVEDCVAMARGANVDLVVGLGGGSPLDVAKMAAILIGSDQPLADMYGIGNVSGSRLPLVQIPTTSGTGSEVTNISILTRPDKSKMGIVAPQLFADKVILDAELTVGLPRLHTAATGIDAMVHAIEAYTSQHKKNPLSDTLARSALEMLAENLLAVCEEGSDREAREKMLLGSTLAGQAFANSPVAAVHALAYPLGGHFGITHGLSNALMLGPVLRFNVSAAAPLYAELADVLRLAAGSDTNTRCDAFISHLEELMDKSGAPRRLRDAGVTEDSLTRLAQDAMLQQRLLINNPVEVSEDDALALYREAF